MLKEQSDVLDLFAELLHLQYNRQIKSSVYEKGINNNKLRKSERPKASRRCKLTRTA